MGKWLSGLSTKYPEPLGHSTDKTDKTPVRNFCQLVRHYGADRSCLLSYEEIMAELDADDIACLPTLDRHDKQVWAEMLADRLTRIRTVEPGGRRNRRIRPVTMNKERTELPVSSGKNSPTGAN